MVSFSMGVHLTDRLGAQSGVLENTKIISFEPQKEILISANWHQKTVITSGEIQRLCEITYDVMQRSGVQMLVNKCPNMKRFLTVEK